jgi:hypothetical protein
MVVELKIVCPTEPFNGKSVAAKTTPEAIMTTEILHNISLLDELYMQLLVELTPILKNS